MKLRQFSLNDIHDIESHSSKNDNHLILAFADRKKMELNQDYTILREKFPTADIVMASTSGTIQGDEIKDNETVVTSILFEKTRIEVKAVNIKNCTDSHKGGEALVEKFDTDGLKSLIIISDGHIVNGTHLVEGVKRKLPKNVVVTGGLAGDGADFQKTLVGLNENPEEANIVGIGLYGDNIKIGHGSFGGWDSFGPERIVTKSDVNVLYELDGESALELYKKYLGELASQLPSSALLFPLKILTDKKEHYLVRTILNVDEEKQSMTFAGNIPQGAKVQLMKANFDNLIDGASMAASQSLHPLEKGQEPDLALLISCVGRKLVLGQRAEEELEECRAIFGKQTVFSGFYSYGEISPFHGLKNCELHNQTMTITTLTEV